MKTTTLNIYSFDELSQEAKEVAVDSLCSINVEHDWWDFTYEDARQIGLKLESFDLDRNKHVKGRFLLTSIEVAAKICQEHGKDCETYRIAATFSSEYDSLIEKYSDGIDKYTVTEENEYVFNNIVNTLSEDFANDLLEEYANILQRECDYLQSEEAIIETIKANEYEFLESGKKY
jgi:hypothetical protein